MIVIVIGQGKGGVGKTTLAVNVAGDIHRYGRSVTLVDADPQASAVQWAEPRRLSFPVRAEAMTARTQLAWVRNVLKSSTDFVILDLPSGFGPLFETAILIADLLVVPCGPSSLDIGAAGRTILKARDVRRTEAGGPPLKIVTVPTRVDRGTPEGEQIEDALADLGEPVGPALSYDIAFVRSFAAGATVAMQPEAAPAAEEVKRLSLFLLRQIMPRQDWQSP